MNASTTIRGTFTGTIEIAGQPVQVSRDIHITLSPLDANVFISRNDDGGTLEDAGTLIYAEDRPDARAFLEQFTNALACPDRQSATVTA